MKTPIKVVLADDHPLMRKNINALLKRDKDIAIVGTAVDGEDVIKLVQTQAPDVVVMDVNMPRVDGIEATKRIKALSPTVKVVILSMHSDDTLVTAALQNGAEAYVLKRYASQDLVKAVHAVFEKHRFLSLPLRNIEA
jgi:two-component system response regulator DegU